MFKIVLSILIMTYAYCSEDISSIEQSIKGYAKEYLYQDGVEASRVTRYIEEGIGILNIHLSEIQTQNDLEFIFQTAFDKFIGILQNESIQTFRDHISPLIQEYLEKKNI